MILWVWNFFNFVFSPRLLEAMVVGNWNGRRHDEKFSLPPGGVASSDDDKIRNQISVDSSTFDELPSHKPFIVESCKTIWKLQNPQIPFTGRSQRIVKFYDVLIGRRKQLHVADFFFSFAPDRFLASSPKFAFSNKFGQLNFFLINAGNLITPQAKADVVRGKKLIYELKFV